MKNNELERLFTYSNIDFISIAAKFLNDKKYNRELLARLYELKGTNCDDISYKIALLIVECVLAELMSEHDDKLFENVRPKKKKKKKNEEEDI